MRQGHKLEIEILLKSVYELESPQRCIRRKNVSRLGQVDQLKLVVLIQKSAEVNLNGYEERHALEKEAKPFQFLSFSELL